jgi:hypothetical protein
VDSQQFSAVFDGLMRCLPHLSGQQSETLRMLLERNGALVQCLAIIEERGARMRRCPHCAATRIYKHGMSAGLQSLSIELSGLAVWTRRQTDQHACELPAGITSYWREIP